MAVLTGAFALDVFAAVRLLLPVRDIAGDLLLPGRHLLQQSQTRR